MVKKHDQGQDGVTMEDPRLVRLPLSELKLDPNNARLHTDRQLEEMAAALDRFQQQSPLIVDQDNIVLKGNGTLLAAQRLGWKSLLCLPTTITDPEERRAYAIADNRLSDLSEFDEEQLASQLRGLSERDLLKGTGFDDVELQELNEILAPSAGVTPQQRAIGNGSVPTVRIVIAVPNMERFERAMQATGEMNREKALLKISDFYLNHARAEERQLDD